MLRSCRNHFRCFSQMKITKLELFRNALKIILVGTGNVLSPHKYFQFERTLKNVIVNSESTFWDIYGKPPFGAFPKRLLEGLGDQGTPFGAPHEGGTLEGAAPPWGSTCHPFMPFIPFVCDIKWGHFWYFRIPILPLGFPINRR